MSGICFSLSKCVAADMAAHLKIQLRQCRQKSTFEQHCRSEMAD